MMPLLFGANGDEGWGLKPDGAGGLVAEDGRPPSDGCELKLRQLQSTGDDARQPPLGG